MAASTKTKTIYDALLEVQKNLPGLKKDARNPHFGNEYVSLENLIGTILPLLNEAGFVLIQTPSFIGEEPALRTQLVYTPTGEWVGDTMPLTLDKQNSQGQGSAITYARRYSLVSLLGLVADEDDDGNAASPSKPKTRRVLTSDGPVIEETTNDDLVGDVFPTEL